MESLKFATFHCGFKIYVPTLSKNRITKIDRWSAIDEVLRYLHSRESDEKLTDLKEQIAAMSRAPVGKKLYSPEIMVRAFEYYSTSRALYTRLKEDLKLPSIPTLSRLTSRVSEISDSNFINRVFESLSTVQKDCIILFDEVYVKKMMTYHGGSVFGKACNNPSMLANSVLGLMIDCMFGGPTFLSKMVPVAKLNVDFLLEQINELISSITSSNGSVIAFICDGNRTNQSVFKRFTTVDDKPWRASNNLFLLFDYVHISKNIRNNWMTEKTGELVYEDNGVLKTAKWDHLLQLYRAESSQDPILKLSRLNEKSVMPKHTEKQSVSLCLQVFCDETATALLTHSATKNETGIEETAFFIQKVVKFWKIVNVKHKGEDMASNDPLKAVISDPNDVRLNYLLQFGTMCLNDIKAQEKSKAVDKRYSVGNSPNIQWIG